MENRSNSCLPQQFAMIAKLGFAHKDQQPITVLIMSLIKPPSNIRDHVFIDYSVFNTVDVWL